MIIDMKKEANKRGIEVRIVAGAEVQALLKKFDETANMSVAHSVSEARAMAA
jgi:small nuclear ribonucleoprotein (snRNP)-like protein